MIHADRPRRRGGGFSRCAPGQTGGRRPSGACIECEKERVRRLCAAGAPCKRGHVGGRCPSSGSCIECTKEDRSKRAETTEPCKYGHTSGRGLSGNCLECTRVARRKMAERNSPCKHGHAGGRYSNGACKQCYMACQRKRRGLPPAPYPCPEICEVPGCNRKADTLEHCHATEVFRGWTCRQCNRLLGQLGDDLYRLDMRTTRLRRYLLARSHIAWMDYV